MKARLRRLYRSSIGGTITELERTEQLLTEIRDLLAGHEKRYGEYLARVEAIADTQHQRHSEYLAQSAEMYKTHLVDVRLERKRGRIGLFLLALIIGILLWAVMLYVILRVD